MGEHKTLLNNWQIGLPNIKYTYIENRKVNSTVQRLLNVHVFVNRFVM